MVAVPLAAALIGLGGCGDSGEDLIEESELRDCLAGKELAIEAPDVASSAGLGNVSPDFRAVTAEGVVVDVVVQRSEQKAARTAADIRGALQSFGAASSEVLAQRNAVLVIDGTPSEDSRAALDDCLADGD